MGRPAPGKTGCGLSSRSRATPFRAISHRTDHAMPNIRLILAPMNSASLRGKWGKRAMKAVLLGVFIAMTSALAQAEDMAEMISEYRRAHGLSTVKTDPQLTAIAERQAKAMAASGIMDHSVAGSFSSRMSGARTGMAAENIAAGTSTWAETLRK